jgi:predicted nucleic acid-binding protein
MNDKVFLDTNILVYSVDTSQGERKKREICRRLIRDSIDAENGVISIQVVQEFLVVTTRKLKEPLAVDRAIEYLKVLSVLQVIHPDLEMAFRAARLQERYKLSFWDAMIVQAASAAECTIIFTEDMKDGLEVGKVKVRNPFRGL